MPIFTFNDSFFLPSAMIDVKTSFFLFIDTPLYFFMQVDAAILEVGLGGKFDATNAVRLTGNL